MSATRSSPSPLSPHADLYNRIIDALVAARKDAQLSQVVLAERLGRPQSFVSKYEHRERILNVAEFVDIAVAIGGDPIGLLAAVLRETTP